MIKATVVAFLLSALYACAAAPTSLPHNPAAFSWDQETLKRNDRGCPTAIFVAPGGELVQCQQPTVVPPPKAAPLKVFDTADAAAIYVTSKIYEISHWYEYGGVILQRQDGKFLVSLPHTDYHGMNVNIDEDPESYDFKIVATYHIHPCLENAFSSVFSPQDLAGARSSNHGGYMADFCTGAVHYWAPGDAYLSGDDAIKLGVSPIALMQGVQLATGKIVGHFAVGGTKIR